VTSGIEIRVAREDDLDEIVPWTTTTFDWGDYVPQRFNSWLDDPDSVVLVCVDGSDRPIAMCHVLMLSESEGWLEAARVHPDHRRSGLGSALNQAGVSWLAERGARVVRLAIGAGNRGARSQVEKLGYRPVSSWAHGETKVGRSRTTPAQYRLRHSPPNEADAAWVFWSNSELAAAGRELIALGWRWRRTRPDDLKDAVSDRDLYQSPAGWVVVDQPELGLLRTGWLATEPVDAPLLFQGLLDLALERRLGEVSLKVPAAPWAVEAMTRAGWQPGEVVIYAKTALLRV
jgi:GNAT superfamily N-acetyltransferase